MELRSLVATCLVASLVASAARAQPEVSGIPSQPSPGEPANEEGPPPASAAPDASSTPEPEGSVADPLSEAPDLPAAARPVETRPVRAESAPGDASSPGTPTRALERRRDLDLFIGGEPALDVLVIGVGAVLWAVGSYALDPRQVDIAPLDGAGYRPYRHDAGVASNATVGASLGLLVAGSYLTERLAGQSWARSFRAPLVLGEALLVGSVGLAFLKNLGVCRPYAWDEASHQCMDGGGVPVDREERHRSFPSSHTGVLGAIAGASYGLWLLPRQARREFIPLALGATALAWLTGGLRVRTGAHSWVDVTGGFFVAGTLGFLTSAMHLRTPRVAVSPTSQGLVVHGRF